MVFHGFKTAIALIVASQLYAFAEGQTVPARSAMAMAPSPAPTSSQREEFLVLDNEKLNTVITQTFADDLERAEELRQQIARDLSPVTEESDFEISTFFERDGRRFVQTSFLATEQPSKDTNFSMKFIAVSENLQPSTLYGAVLCGFAHPEACTFGVDSLMIPDNVLDSSLQRCGGGDIKVEATHHFCELIAEGYTNELGEIVFIGEPTIASLVNKTDTIEGDIEMHVALVRLPPKPAPARKLLQEFGVSFGYGNIGGNVNRYGVSSNYGNSNYIVAEDPYYERNDYNQVAYSNSGYVVGK